MSNHGKNDPISNMVRDNENFGYLPMTRPAVPHPLVSVIIPTMDRLDKLKRAVRSVIDQTYDGIELVIIEEGGPKAKVPDLLSAEEIGSNKFVHIFNEDPSGVASARNQAVEHCSGEYLAFLDDDDEWYPTKIEKQVNKLETCDADVCYTGAERIGPNGKLRSTTVPDVEGDARRRTLRGSIISPSAFMISKKAFETIGGFDNEIPYWEDWDFLYRLSQEFQFTGVDELLCKIHTDAEDRLSGSFELAEQGAEYLINKHTPIIFESKNFPTRKFKSRIWQGVGRSALMNGYFKQSRQYFFRAILIWPIDRELYPYTVLSIGGRSVLRLAQNLKRIAVRVMN